MQRREALQGLASIAALPLGDTPSVPVVENEIHSS